MEKDTEKRSENIEKILNETRTIAQNINSALGTKITDIEKLQEKNKLNFEKPIKFKRRSDTEIKIKSILIYVIVCVFLVILYFLFD